MAKYQKQVPAKSARNQDTLAARFDDSGNPTELKWYTRKGLDLVPDDLVYNKQGQSKRLKNGGWKVVDVSDFEPAPAPLTADQVKSSDPNAVVTTTGSDPIKPEDIAGMSDKEIADKVRGIANDTIKAQANESKEEVITTVGAESGDADKAGDQDQKAASTKKKAVTDPKTGDTK